ncbi:hypothetical protein AB0D00_26605 [Streptomyces sp. NPDC048213]|uniref:hypothetical protein n=1 Tax=Streptomyces sp. NPDC048213 TaxID=3160984 RepID=UPI0033CA13C5
MRLPHSAQVGHGYRTRPGGDKEGDHPDNKKGKGGIAIAAQGGWARYSHSTPGYMQRDDEWDDDASVGLA